jgi:hypothetical protein
MSEQRVTGVECEPEVLAAPSCCNQAASRQPTLEVKRSELVAPNRTWMKHADALDTTTDRQRLKPSADDLYLRQLGHRSSCLVR